MAARLRTAELGRVVKIDITPKEFFQEWSRKQKGDLIEYLIDTLDTEAGDPDLEPSHGREMVPGEVDDAEADSADEEPSLGSIDHYPSLSPYSSHAELMGWTNQSIWAGEQRTIFVADCEGDEHDGREPDNDDDEPSLG